MKISDFKGQFQNPRDLERALHLRRASIAILGAWLLNFVVMMAGFSYVFSTGIPVSVGRRHQPRVLVSKGVYRQVGPTAYAYVVSHEVATVILTLIFLPCGIYWEYKLLTTRREGMNRGAI